MRRRVTCAQQQEAGQDVEGLRVDGGSRLAVRNPQLNVLRRRKECTRMTKSGAVKILVGQPCTAKRLNRLAERREFEMRRDGVKDHHPSRELGGKSGSLQCFFRDKKVVCGMFPRLGITLMVLDEFDERPAVCVKLLNRGERIIAALVPEADRNRASEMLDNAIGEKGVSDREVYVLKLASESPARRWIHGDLVVKVLAKVHHN